MANLWCDGFARYGGDEAKMLNGSSSQAWAQVGTDWELSSSNPRTGSWHLRADTGSNTSTRTIRRVFGAQLTEVYVGFAMYAHSLPTTESAGNGSDGWCIGEFRDQSNGAQIRIILGTDGALQVERGTDIQNILGRTVPVIGAGAYQHIEIYAKAGSGTGAVEIRVDEVTRLNLTGITTVRTANVEFSQFAQYFEVKSTSNAIIDFADYFANDTTADGSGCDDFVGDCKSGCLFVNADTATADWDLSTGATGYTLLDEAPPNDADYIFTDSTTAESQFGLEDGPANLTEILTVRPFDRAFKDDAGTCTIAPNMVSNSTKGTVSSQPISTGASYYDSNVPLDPDTAAPWTLSALNAALRSVERTA